MKLRGQYFIVAHLPYDESKNIKAGGRMMWIKFLDTEDKPELFTIYNNVQSQDHKITLGQSEKYSLKEDGEYISEKSEKAVTKLQAFSRGNKVRQDAKTVRTEKEAAATKIQALGRGKIGRQKAKEEEEKNAALEDERKTDRERQLKIREDYIASRKLTFSKFNETQQQEKNLAAEKATKLEESNRKAALKAEEEFQQQKRAAQEEQERAAQEEQEQAEREEKKRAAEEKRQRKLQERDAREQQQKEKDEENRIRWAKEAAEEDKEHKRKIAAAKATKEAAARKEARKTQNNHNEQQAIDAIAADIYNVGVGVNVKKPNRKTRKQRLQTSFDKREGKALKQEEVNEKERIREKLITGAKDELNHLSEQYHDSTFLQRVAHNLSPETHTERKIKLIKDINTQIEIYNSTGLHVEPLNVESLSEKSISTIRQALNVVIGQMGPRGGKSTRRRRRKMNPTRKIGHKKPKTKKKSNKGVVKRRKTRSKK